VAKRCLRETDFAFRYGGEEFTILLPMTTGAEGSLLKQRIREFWREYFVSNDNRVIIPLQFTINLS
jgi:GGDEF domain-containing protein